MVRKSKDFESKIFSFIMTKFLQKVRKLWKFKFHHLTQLFYLKYRVANKKLFLGFCFSNPLIYFQEYQQIKEEVTFSVYLSFLRTVWYVSQNFAKIFLVLLWKSHKKYYGMLPLRCNAILNYVTSHFCTLYSSLCL